MSLPAPLTFEFDRSEIVRSAEALGLLGTGRQAAPRVIALLCQPQVTAREVAALIECEPALYARVLKVANSPFHGRRGAIRTLQQAVVLLGLDAVRGIAAAACLDRHLSVDRTIGALDVHAMVTHSLATAIAAEALAKARLPQRGAEAYIAGLMHNLGVAVQLRIEPAGVERLIARRRTEPGADVRRVEADSRIVGHEECIATVFECWGLPSAFVNAARHHHAPAEAPPADRDLAALVTLGATLATASGFAFALEPPDPTHDPMALQLLGIGREELEALTEVVPERVAALKEALREP
jgi:HD-like signal output (HDOD) protein